MPLRVWQNIRWYLFEIAAGCKVQLCINHWIQIAQPVWIEHSTWSHVKQACTGQSDDARGNTILTMCSQPGRGTCKTIYWTCDCKERVWKLGCSSQLKGLWNIDKRCTHSNISSHTCYCSAIRESNRDLVCTSASTYIIIYPIQYPSMQILLTLNFICVWEKLRTWVYAPHKRSFKSISMFLFLTWTIVVAERVLCLGAGFIFLYQLHHHLHIWLYIYSWMALLPFRTCSFLSLTLVRFASFGYQAAGSQTSSWAPPSSSLAVTPVTLMAFEVITQTFLDDNIILFFYLFHRLRPSMCITVSHPRRSYLI